MNVRLFAGLPLLLMLLAGPAAAQSADVERSQSLFRSGTSLVALNVTVTDAQKQSVTGLQLEDFAVYEDGVEQDIRFFETAAVPIDLVVLIDTSSSMRHQLDIVHKAAEGFIATLRSGDRGAIVAFNDGVDVVQEFTGDRETLRQAIRGTSARGGTALYNALYISLKQFGQAARLRDDIRRQAIVVLSDGDDTASLIGFDDVIQVARRSGVHIYPIALESDVEVMGGRKYFSSSQYSIRQLARETGAEAFFPKNAYDLPAIYGSIAAELAGQYSLGYAPSNGRADGRFRRIVVRVVSRPELRPRARMGYVAEADRAALFYQGGGKRP